MDTSKIRIFLLASVFALALSGCHNNKQLAKTATPTAPPAVRPAPVAELTVVPAAVEKGQQALLTWNTKNAARVVIDGVGEVAGSGSQRVAPTISTTYHLKATGDGGAAEASARLTVNDLKVTASEATEEELFKRNVKDIFFNYDKYDIRSDEQQAVSSDAQFLVQHSAVKLVIEGHCDERGSEDYNMALGQDRASTVKEQLVQHGINAGRIRIVSYGKEKPFCSAENESCFQQNRRAHFVFSN